MNLTPLQQDIIKARANRFRVRRLLKEVLFKYDPYKPRDQGYLDELISLGCLLSEMDNLRLTYTRAEVRAAFKEYYKEKQHDNKRTYLSFLCVNALKKRKFTTVVGSSQIRDNGVSDSNRTAVIADNALKPTVPSPTHKKRYWRKNDERN